MKPTMARSDSEDVYEVTDGGTPGALLAKLQDIAVDDALLDKRNDATIHSGHFMVSHVHDDEPPDDVVAAEEADATLRHGDQPPPPPTPRGGIVDDVETVLRLLPPPVGRQSPYGSAVLAPGSACGLLIDGSLTKLFECMSLAHCNKLTSPKWKNFKGVNVRLKDKIRLNNIIWREWHMQYIKGISPIVCHFESELSSKSDDTIDYWKLRLNSLTRDYKRLSRFLARRFSAQPDDHELLTKVLSPSYYELLQRVSHSNSPKMTSPSLITVPMFSAGDSIIRDDETINDWLDTLFTPQCTSSSRGNSSNFNSQMSLEEFMDTLEPLPPPLAVDFRGFGRLSSSVSGVGASAITSASMTLPIAPIGLCNAVPAMQPPQQQLPPISSQTLSFGSAEELLALLQSQLASESSLEHLIDDPPPAVGCSDYSGTNIQPGFSVSDDNLASYASGISLLSTDGIEMQEYPRDSTSQLCSMFFLPEATPLPVQSMSLFTPVGETPKTNATACSQLSMQLHPVVESKLQLQDFIQDATGMAMSEQSKLSHPCSSSLPRLKPSHNLEMVDRGSKSLGSIQTNEDARSLSNSKSSNESQPRQALKRFRTPQNTGPRHLPQLQPRPQNTCSSVYQQVTHARPDMSLIITNQPMKPAVSTGDWSIVMSTGTNQLTIPILNQFAVGQDIQISSKNAAQGNRSAETKRRVRHKSDQSSAAKGTTIRPIAVFQPINPLQTASNTGRTSSKTNCSVSFSLDKNTAISPAPVFDPSMFQLHDLSNSIIMSTPGNSVAFAPPAHAYDEAQNGAFGEIRSCPGIFETSFHPSDFSLDSVSLNSSSARSRHTSNESNRSTSSHYDDVQFGAKQKSETRRQSKEHRRASHITAEQKRRCNIKCGFDTLVGLIPDMKDSSNSRVSKAVALHKAAELCKKMKQERKDELQEMEQLRNEIKSLTAEISACQSKLPDSGAPPIKQPVEQLNERYDEYFYKRTLENWKFFIFSSLIAWPLIKSFDEEVIHGSFDQLQKSVQSWIQTHCSLASLRPRVTNALVDLSKQTSILSNPSLVPEEVKTSVLHHRNCFR